MVRLLKANFNRLKKDLSFYIMLVIIIVFSISFVFNGKNPSHCVSCPLPNIKEILFAIYNLIGIFIAIFTSLFIGTDYADGVIRNKIIVGHKRKNIYLANLITSMMVGFIYSVIYMIIIILIGSFFFAKLDISANMLFFYLLDIICLIIVFSSIYTLISMLIANKTASSITAIIFSFWSFIGAEVLRQKIYTAGGFKLQLYKFIFNLIPTGQGIQISELSSLNYKSFWIYSLILIIIINGVGIYIFNNKDLK